MALPRSQSQTRLLRFDFDALFCKDLGWARVSVDQLNRLSSVRPDPLIWELVAELDASRGLVVISGPLPEAMVPEAFHRWLDQFTQLYRDPLVVWIDPNAQRSLWCWLGGDADPSYWRTRCVIKGQVDRDWALRLGRLQADHFTSDRRLCNHLNRFSTGVSPDLLAGFQQSWQTLTHALAAIPQARERQHYAMVILGRLMVAAGLQQRGYLGGDEWYLHNQFGQSQQRGRDQFFQTVFQPLCQQGLTLPPEERSLPVQQRLGALPFLPTGPFVPNALDQRWSQLPITDGAFEPVLNWLGDLLMAADGNYIERLLGLGERLINGREGANLTTPEPVLIALCDRTLNATLLDRAATLTGHPYHSVDHLLMAIPPSRAAQLLEELGRLTVLDPACGSGRFLVTALQHLIYLAHTLKGVAALGTKTAVPQWVRLETKGTPPAVEESSSDTLAICRHLLTHSLYGVDLWPPAVELARLQLFLQAVEHTTNPQELAGLPDLTLTILQGNGLIGLVRVEDERFEQVQPKGRRAARAAPSVAETTLQGNLLQPLLADTYQGVLAERQVRLEHYRSQTQLLAEAGNVPTYAQADFLRDRIQELNQIAQAKLTHLLWSECSQQIGIRVQYQDVAGRRQTRPLELSDVEALDPFHWGFYFHHLLQHRGGFDVILGHLPIGVVQPSEAEFMDHYQDLFQQKYVTPSTFLRNRQQVLTIDADLTRAWCDYRGRFSFPNQYFRRSNQYPQASQSPGGRSQGRLHWSRLYLERSLQLLRPGGRCGLVLEPFWDQANSAPLRHWLQAHTRLGTVMDISNHRGLWPALPPRTALSLLWLKREKATLGCPYVAYKQAAKALSPTALGVLLQSLIDLAE